MSSMKSIQHFFFVLLPIANKDSAMIHEREKNNKVKGLTVLDLLLTMNYNSIMLFFLQNNTIEFNAGIRNKPNIKKKN